MKFSSYRWITASQILVLAVVSGMNLKSERDWLLWALGWGIGAQVINLVRDKP